MLAVVVIACAAAASLDVNVGDATLDAAIAKDGDAFLRSLERYAPATSVRVQVRAAELSPQLAGRSEPGRMFVRTSGEQASVLLAVRHELVHQWLWRVCPQTSRDRLFHETIAVALSGEVPLWRSETYMTAPQAKAVVQTAVEKQHLDSPQVRRALARLLTEGNDDPTSHEVVRVGLARCNDGARIAGLTVDDLTVAAPAAREALVVLARHSGEFLELKGETAQAMPFGSTLKPFIIAAAVDRALDKDHVMSFPQRRNDPMWACGDHGVTSKMDAATALSYSCNGWFLEYERRYGSTIPSLAFGAYTELLQSLGLEHEPWDMSEAIGLRTSLTITPRGAAHAYRALFDRASASVVRALKSSGTVVRSDGVARKTGSVRDHDSTPILGWLVAVTDDLVIVRTKPGVAGAALADEVDAVIERYRGRRDLSRVDVQVFGLVAPSDVMVRCDGAIADVAYPPKYVVRPPRRGVEPAAYALHNIVTGASTLGCFGGPWRVSIEGGPERRYAGFFSFWKAPPLSEAAAKRATPKQQNARRGSDIVFTTTRARYVQGVLIAEDSSLRGEAKAALARVIDHNADASKARHGDRPVCDTTHCQTFLGTRDGYPDDDVMRAIAVPLSSTGRDGWLPFSQGGSEPWQEYRPVWEARAAVGTFSAIKMDGNTVVVVRPMVDKGNHFDVTAAMPCEVLRSHLKLPSCPSSVEVNGNAMLFRGVGRGHGLGLNVEAAKTMAKKGKSADDILDAAYPR